MDQRISPEALNNVMAAVRRNSGYLADAARKGSGDAAYYLGLCHALGDHEVEPDYDAALAWYRRAAKADVSGTYVLAAMCAVKLALDVRPDDLQAVEAALGWIGLALEADGDATGWLLWAREELLAQWPELADWEASAEYDVRRDVLGFWQ